jgi:hypothetical protein
MHVAKHSFIALKFLQKICEHELPDYNQISAKLIQVGKAIAFEIHKFTRSVCNEEELPQLKPDRTTCYK